MTADKRVCPQCGEPVYPSDDVCMSCGADLRAGATPPGPPAPPPPVPPPRAGPVAPGALPNVPRPAPAPRQERELCFSERVVTRCGKYWDLYPWIGIICYALLGMLYAVHASGFLIAIVGIVYVPWVLLYLGWLVCDVIANGAPWWWILVGLLCYPLGFVVYLFMGR